MCPMTSATVLRFESAAQLLQIGDVSSREIVHGRYAVRLARTQHEVDAALRLRFEVFNLERGEGLATSFTASRDEDEFDASSHHLILLDRARGQVIGTCRLRTFEHAKTTEGFYTSSEFDLSSLPHDVLRNAIEISRACIAKPYRNVRTFLLLWKGLALYSQHQQKTHLFGCCSLSSQDPVAGGQVFELLNEAGHLHTEFRVQAQVGFKCLWYKTSDFARRKLVARNPLQTYLRFGAQVCGPPAMNRQFRTIDFFTMLDLNGIGPRVSSLLARLSRAAEDSHEFARSA
jgi:putative hemolysin